MVSQSRLVAAWRHVLSLSRLRPQETVVLLTRPDANGRNVEAAEHAIADLGAFGMRLQPIANGQPLRASGVAMAALKGADLVVDFIGLHTLRTHEQGDVLKAQTRMLFVVEPPEALVRLLPDDDDKRRVKAAEEVLRRSKLMHVTSAAGTDLVAEIGEYPILSEWGFADEPGHWDHWPSGFIATWPNERSARGTVVLEAGDIIFPFKDYVRTPISLRIEGGYIRRIEGGFDADFLRSYIEEFADPEAYAVSHLGWGLNPRARWTALGLLDKAQTNGNDGRAFAGNFLFSTGPNTDGGGARDTLCHLDIPMRNCSLSLDGVPMTVAGKVVAPGQT